MNAHINLRVLILIACFAGLLMVYYGQRVEKERRPVETDDSNSSPRMTNQTAKETDSSERYSISSQQCKMPDPDPWDSSVRKYLGKPKPVVCSHLPPLTRIDQTEYSTSTLKVDQKILKKYKVNSTQSLKCCYSLITRLTEGMENYTWDADNLFLLHKCNDFSERVSLPESAEFVLAKCRVNEKGTKKNGKEIYKNMHAIVPVVASARSKMKKSAEVKKKLYEKYSKGMETESKRLNVILIGIDSVSKLNLKRVMPKTLKYLRRKRWVELKGYNKIGENTFPNLMAILNGEPMEKLNFWWKNPSRKMDDVPTIWKDYSAAGYVTLYAEDTPSISTFNLGKIGFVEKPTDYYMRPFMIAAHQLLPQKRLYGLPVCTGPVLVLDHIFNYAKKFYRTFNDSPHFSLLWSNSLSHNDLNAPKALDDSVHKFLNDLSNLKTYDNSLVLILSDHGIRFGSIRETFIGYLEERLPFAFVWFPQWFREKHPEKYGNLVINQNRLTCPYDIHVMLKALLRIDEIERNAENATERVTLTKPISAACPKCTGLLEIQPLERTCRDASIDVNWCTCSEFRDLDIGTKEASDVANFIYHYIVDRTWELMAAGNVKKTLCSVWEFSKLYRVQEVVPNRKPENSRLPFYRSGKLSDEENEKIYVAVVELNPGQTKFEATIKIGPGKTKENFNFLEYPKRLDGIYKTSKCVNGTSLKHYCYCILK